MTKSKKEGIRKGIVYGISVILMVVSFFLPPLGVIDPSVLMATAILIAGHEWLYGHSIKSINIDKSGIHIETHEHTKE